MTTAQQWVCCIKSEGYRHENGEVSKRKRELPNNAIAWLAAIDGDIATIWLIGKDETWDVPADSIEPIDVLKTGDKFAKKICNSCHCLFPTKHFARNQNNKHGIVRRPSCPQCRTDIDKRPPKSSQAKRMEKNRPRPGSVFRCPICDRRAITGVTAKVVADHNHHTGDIRDFICDSCNTGLGRFKNGKDHLKDAVHYIEEREG